MPPTANPAGAPAIPQPIAELPSIHREITPVQLLATIYYNTGVDLLTTKKQHAEAVAVNIKALYLDKDNEQAWANLCAAINNWALELVEKNRAKKHYHIASVLLDQGVVLDPAFPNFRQNQIVVFHGWISALASKGLFDDAHKVFALADESVRQNEHMVKLHNGVKEAEKTIMQQRK
jgi:tetratricopeptide (TPR) repeat protein